MLNEIRNFFNDLYRFRINLNESVGESLLVNAIKDHEYVYVYYEGEGLESKGYRIIKPYVLGVDKRNGVKSLRAWQTEGDSDSYKGKNRTPRMDHERFKSTNKDGKGVLVPGWRMFRLDKIKSVYPTGRTFKNDPLPPFYKGGDDKHMSTIISSIPTTTHPKDDKDKPTPSAKVAKDYLTRTDFDRILEKSYNLVKNIKKRAPSKVFIYVGKDGSIKFASERGLKNIDDDKIIGNLQELFNEYVLPKKTQQDNFLELKRRESYQKFK